MGSAVPQGYVSATHARWLATAPDRRWREEDATLVFADVSGFTAMSEKLARRGKIGAEETTEAINHVFGGLLGAAAGHGGEILKFGGDAVLALFTGEAHAERGRAAAVAMQTSMRPLRRYRTAAGTVTLRLSVGVASGPAHLFLAGSAPRELIVAGPLASEVVACESAAEAGQVVASPGGLLRSAPPAPAVPAPTVPPGFDPRPALPLHMHGHVPGDHEHRFASIGFVQFKGIDALLAESGPDAVARLLDRIVATVGEACLAHGVTFVSTDVDRDGGKAILAAGAPTASPDDEDRLLHALRAVVEPDWPVPVRAGANRGRVFMVDIGPPERRAWSLMGDAVNLAARVMARAAPGTVLATPSVLERTRDDFERVPVEPFMVKGKSAPVHAESVGPARGARRAATGHEGPLVGRERELAAIREALEDARAGDRVAIELVGEPGLGKSRLVEAAVAAAGDHVILGVAGGPYAVHSPYRALRAPLRELLGVRADEDDETAAALLASRAEALDGRLTRWLPLIAIPFGVELPATPETESLSPEFARARMHGAVGRLLDLLLPARPLLIVVEDGHWLDEASSDLIGSLVRQGRRSGGHCVIVTRRDVPDGLRLGDAGADVRTLRLGPLPAAAALHLVKGTSADDRLPPEVEAKLVERAAGNPLLLQELLAAARAGEPLDALPDTVEALVTARIDTLPQGERQFLRQAAVLGVRVPAALLEALLGWDAFAVRGAIARLGDFLVEDGPQTVRFRHALLRDAAYEALPYRRRQDLHARAGRLIEERAGAAAIQQAELLTIHFHAARRWPETWRYARAAAEHALGRAAPVEAAAFLAQALEAGRALADVGAGQIADVAERLGDAAKLAGRAEQAMDAYAQARRARAGDPVALAGLCFKEGRLRDGTRHVAQALRWYTRGLRELDRAGDGAEVAALHAQLVLAHGAARMRAGRLRESLPYLRRAAREAKACGARESLAHAYYCLDAVLTDLGDPAAAEFRMLALPIYEDLGDYAGQAKVLCNLGIDAYYEGRWEEAVALYERSRDASERIGDVVQIAMNVNNIGEIRSDQGRLDEAQALFEEALSIWRAAEFGLGVGSVLANLGRVETRRGDTDRAASYLQRAREALTATGSDAFVLEVDAREAERLIAAGAPAAALMLAGGVRTSAQRLGANPTLLSTLQRVAAAAKAALGDDAAARERTAEAIEFARSVGAAYEEALALELAGRLGDGDAAEGARVIFERLGVTRRGEAALV